MKGLVFVMAFGVVAQAQGQATASRITSPAEGALLAALVAAEDSRRPIVGDDPRTTGLASGNAFLRAFTVRGLGRLENPAMSATIEPLLRDPSAEVRIAAADALAQSVAKAPAGSATADDRARIAREVTSVRAQLTGQLTGETDPSVRAMLLESIGRLAQGSVDQVKATASLIAPSLSAASVVERRGAVRGIFFLARKPEARTASAIPGAVTDRLHAMLAEPASAGFTPTDRFTMAFALVGALAMSDTQSARLIGDRDPYVRERAVVALSRSNDLSLVRRLVTTALRDPEPVVRFRGLNLYLQKLRATDGCMTLIALTRDPNMNVALRAADGLSACRGDMAAARHLASLAATLRDDDAWHLPVHAFVSLSVIDSSTAKSLLPRFMAARNFFVRMYADTAARLMGDVASLMILSRDPHANVQASAVAALSRLVGHAADSVYMRALRSDDNQVLMEASAALKASAIPGLADTAAAIWRRRASRGWDTDLDGNTALRELFTSLGGRADDVASPARVPMPLPTFDDLAALERTAARIEMVDGSVITLRLHPFEAPTNAHRFARLARAGTFDGLTFHRVAPFFVVQGPGPNANEYSAPDKPFAREELALSNVRGSVGLSTRGRDTGDGQIYVNTVDNIWLDHEYTVMATVMSGLEAFDRMQEGARIRRVTITP